MAFLFDRRAAEAFKLTHLYLDGLNISAIDSLELFNAVTHLYLQRNYIAKIENLEYLVALLPLHCVNACLQRNLRFLVLSNNRIRTVEGLRKLTRLLFVDLSGNRIETVNPGLYLYSMWVIFVQ